MNKKHKYSKQNCKNTICLCCNVCFFIKTRLIYCVKKAKKYQTYSVITTYSKVYVQTEHFKHCNVQGRNLALDCIGMLVRYMP